MTYAIALVVGLATLSSAVIAIGLARAAGLGDRQLARETKGAPGWRSRAAARLRQTRPV